MTDHICPKEIIDLFRSEKNKTRGQRRAREWAQSLSIDIGDRIWLPESGWTVKKAESA